MEANNKACREALQAIVDYLEPIRKWAKPSEANGTSPTALFAAVDTVYAKAKAALAEPRLNCEVGTVEEQAQRFNDYCHKQGNSCCGRSIGACPMFKGCKVDCAIVWSQTPYEEGGAK